MNRNLCKSVLSAGGDLIPLIISSQDSKGLGLMNPSILLDQSKILLNLRNINYTLFHCEGEQVFNNRFGPLAYLHPENDLHLRTYNFLCELDPDNLSIKNYNPIDTSTLDKPPLWDFVGLEDIRLVRWEGKLYGCGVRRDTTPNGVGRMELSELHMSFDKTTSAITSVKEINRFRIDPPGEPTYCEKNWMPVLDLPYHFVKWSNPIQVVKVDISTGTSETIFLSDKMISGLPDFRGGSQVINWKNYRMALIHEVSLFKNKLEQKDGQYRHRFLIWDRNWNLIKMSEPFSFMDGEIEFGCGLALYKNNVLVSFGFQDNAAFVLKIPYAFFEEMGGLQNDESDKKKLVPKESDKLQFNWGSMHVELKNSIIDEIFNKNTYQKYFKVEEGDVVVDVGSSVGPFTHSILSQKPKQVYCLEPNNKYFNALLHNTKSDNVICINKGISNKNGKEFFDTIWDSTFEGEGITFNSFLKEYNIKKIDFLKLDCEGGEYDIFTEENFKWIKKNVRKIVGEFHLNTLELREKFIYFRDNFLSKFKNVEIDSMTGENVKDFIFDNKSIESHYDFLIYINNEMSLTKKWENVKWPSLEITTTIRENGCVVNCVFCPQKVLTNAYSGDRVMSLENFKKAIDKVPKEIAIIFSGFAEPWLNKQCTDMVVYAHEKGHKIAIFTTGIGMSIEDFDRIKNIPFSLGPEDAKISTKGTPIYNGGFTLHLPDNENYAKHPITDKYIKLLEHILQCYNEVSSIRIVCMGTVNDKIKHIFSDALPVDIWSRANNLNKEVELKPELKELEGKGLWLSAYVHTEDTTCSLDENVYHNVLLPNGNVSLCCMDYNLDHIIGNLYDQKYDEIIPELNTPYELCKYCENGIDVSKIQK